MSERERDDPFLAGMGSTAEDTWGVKVVIYHADAESLSDEQHNRVDRALGAALDASREHLASESPKGPS